MTRDSHTDVDENAKSCVIGVISLVKYYLFLLIEISGEIIYCSDFFKYADFVDIFLLVCYGQSLSPLSSNDFIASERRIQLNFRIVLSSKTQWKCTIHMYFFELANTIEAGDKAT